MYRIWARREMARVDQTMVCPPAATALYLRLERLMDLRKPPLRYPSYCYGSKQKHGEFARWMKWYGSHDL